MENEIINRIEKSGLIQVDLDSFYPKGERVLIDMIDFLHEGLVLMEKPFRELVKNYNWKNYQDNYVFLDCSNDAIIPLWAFMLIVSNLQPFAKKVVMGNKHDLEKAIFNDIFDNLDFSEYNDKNVIVKGCGKHPIPESVFVDFTNRLQNHAKSILFGEACSAVPLFKKK